jgi:hypothetical protein
MAKNSSSMTRVWSYAICGAVQEEAARSMMDAARDAVLSQSAGSLAQISIEVRDDDGAVMRMGFSFEIARKQ